MPNEMKADDAIAGTLRAWAIDHALPLWAGAGYDRTGGGFHERLHLDGTADADAPRRLVVQARQIYVYAHASVLGWFDGTALALDALQAMQERYRGRDGAPGYAHTINADGSVNDARRDTYAHAFILLALGWLAKASGDAQVRGLIDGVLAYFDEHFTAPDGTYYEGVPRTLPRRQNPHMHAFEAMLALHETIAHPDALRRAAALRAQLRERFLEPKSGALAEFFTDGWALRSRHDPVEPGHHAEWAWLLRRHEAMAGLPPDPIAARFTDFAARHRDAQTGLLIDEIRLDGALHARKHRCWPQTEFAKALLAAEEQGGSRHDASEALVRLHRHYLAPRDGVRFRIGGWLDQFDADGKPLTPNMPASTLYHVFCAVAEACRVRGVKDRSDQA